MLKLFIYLIFIFAFFGNSFVGYRFVPPQVTLVTEVSVYLLFLFSLFYSRGERYSWHLWYPVVSFLVIAFCSVVANNYFSLVPITSLRLVIRFYFFYLALINLGLDDDMLKKINKLLFILFIIQLPVVAYKFRVYGISEMTMGSYDTHGGGLTAIIPIVALGYLSGYFFFYQRRLSYVLLAIGFISFGIVGAKRMLLFIYPLSFMGIYFLVYIIGKKENIFRHVSVITCIAVLSVAVMGVILKYNISLNPERKVGGSIDLDHALKYTKWYTTQSDGTTASGRLSNTILTFDTVLKEGAFLFGLGPGSMTGSILNRGRYADERVKYLSASYGRTGLSYILAEYGMLGLIAVSSILIAFALLSWKWYRYEKEPYWKAFAMGTFVFAIYNTFIFLCYNTAPLQSDTITPVYFYAMATMYIKRKEKTQVAVT